MLILNCILYKWSNIAFCNINLFRIDRTPIDLDVVNGLRCTLYVLRFIVIISFLGILRIICKKGTNNKLRNKVLIKVIVYGINFLA